MYLGLYIFIIDHKL